MSARTRRRLLLCGIAAPVLYIALDLLATSQWPAYSYRDQTISELSAIGAPTRALWIIGSVPYVPLMFAFASGVWVVAGARPRLRATALLLFGLAALSMAWLFFPMHLRGTPTTWTDTGHVVLAGIQVVLSFALLVVGAAAFGRRFRWFSIAVAAMLLAAGAVTFVLARGVAAGEPTPWIGVVERVNAYGYMLWLGVLAVAALRVQREAGTRRLPRQRDAAARMRGSGSAAAAAR